MTARDTDEFPAVDKCGVAGPVEVEGGHLTRWFPPCENCEAAVWPAHANGVWFWAHLSADDHCDAPCGPVVVSDATSGRYERIEGWRITEHELGPHPEVESCDETPTCLHVYRLVTAKEGPDA